MALGLLGKKVGMTHIFDCKGKVIPVTLIKIGPCSVTQIKALYQCGYNAIQLGYLESPALSKKLTKPLLFHFLKKDLLPHTHLKEYKVNNPEKYSLGQKIDLSIFTLNEFVTVCGKTIGKGNAGNIKKNKFNRGAMTHGSKHHRLQGSIGAGTSPGRVFPGKRMPGRLGGNLQTIKNIQILDINSENNLLVIKGSLPGKIGNVLSIEKNR